MCTLRCIFTLLLRDTYFLTKYMYRAVGRRNPTTARGGTKPDSWSPRTPGILRIVPCGACCSGKRIRECTWGTAAGSFQTDASVFVSNASTCFECSVCVNGVVVGRNEMAFMDHHLVRVDSSRNLRDICICGRPIRNNVCPRQYVLLNFLLQSVGCPIWNLHKKALP